jgi:outer membrane protein assembly factor BamB
VIRCARVAVVIATVGIAACLDRTPAAPGAPPTVPPSFERVLHIPVEKPFTSLLTPVADADRFYADHVAGPVVAFDRTTGDRVWAFDRPLGAPSSLVLSDGLLLFVGPFAIALDAATGVERWRFDPGGHGGLAVSAAGSGGFYFGTDSSMFALSVATGALQWRNDFGFGWEHRSVVRGVAVHGDRVYVSVERFYSNTGHLATGIVLALDRITGVELWRHTEGEGTDRHYFIFEPRVAGDLLLLADHQANVTIALDRETGAERWRRAGDPGGYFGAFEPPLVSNDTVFSVSADRWITALDRPTGRLLWEQRVDGSLSSGAFCSRLLFVQDLSLHVLDRATGAFVARYAHRMGGESGLLVSRFTAHGDEVFVLGDRAAYSFRCR